MFEFLNITKALAEENRLRILLALLELAPSTVSKHMNVLRQARLVNGHKDGRWMYYRLANGGAPTQVQEAIAWVKRSLIKDERIRNDGKRLKEILKIGREVLCNRQTRSSAGQNS